MCPEVVLTGGATPHGWQRSCYDGKRALVDECLPSLAYIVDHTMEHFHASNYEEAYHSCGPNNLINPINPYACFELSHKQYKPTMPYEKQQNAQYRRETALQDAL